MRAKVLRQPAALDGPHQIGDRDEMRQVESYASRKKMSVEDVERWLAPNLAYEPGTVGVAG